VKFSDHELTLAADAGARFLFTARQMPWRRGSVAARWKAMKPAQKYPHRSAAGELVLPALAALPERDTPGEVPTFTADELAAAARDGARAAYEQGGRSWTDLGEKKQARRAAVTLVVLRAAVAGLPRRANPQAPPEVPDFVPDDLI
jgi:hypothetical protein